MLTFQRKHQQNSWQKIKVGKNEVFCEAAGGLANAHQWTDSFVLSGAFYCVSPSLRTYVYVRRGAPPLSAEHGGALRSAPQSAPPSTRRGATLRFKPPNVDGAPRAYVGKQSTPHSKRVKIAEMDGKFGKVLIY